MSILDDKLKSSKTPKTILSLDGGGVRGILTLGILEKIEKKVQEKGYSNLGDYYDLICGTSTGAIIACGLATGKSVGHMIELYKNLGKEIFGKGRKWKIIPRKWKSSRAIFNENYSSGILETFLEDEFGDITIGDKERISCGLAINAKRADTYSLWTVANHPCGKYYEANSNLKLWELCRASSAAPYYFKPKILNLRSRLNNGERKYFDGAFIDGGVSLANNPAWIGFLTATVESFGFKWSAGVNNMVINSIGTGNGEKYETPKDLEKLKALGWAPKLSDLFMTDALEMNLVLLGGFGKNVRLDEKAGYFIDSQFDPPPDLGRSLFGFERHNVKFATETLKEIGFELTDSEIESLKEMDHFENMEILLEIGRKYAQITNFNIL